MSNQERAQELINLLKQMVREEVKTIDEEKLAIKQLEEVSTRCLKSMNELVNMLKPFEKETLDTFEVVRRVKTNNDRGWRFKEGVHGIVLNRSISQIKVATVFGEATWCNGTYEAIQDQ